MNDGDDSSSFSVLTSFTVDENQDDMGDADDEFPEDDDGSVTDEDCDGVNALKMSFDSLATDRPRLEIVLVILLGVGVSGGDLDAGLIGDNDCGTKEETPDVELLLRLRMDELAILYFY